MIKIHFGTPCFGSLNFPRLSPLGMFLPIVHDLPTVVLPQINDYESLHLFNLKKFQTSLLYFLPKCFHPKSTILRHVFSRINGRYVLWPSGLRDFSTQHNLSHISPLECPISRLHNLSPRGEIVEVDTWPN
jgi:hypothetical protein